MRTIRLSAFAALVGLHTLGVKGETTCHADHSLNSWGVTDFSKIQDALLGPVNVLCNRSLNPGENDYVTHEVENLKFAISRKYAVQNIDECNSAFIKIVSQCIRAQNVGGGEAEGKDGISYEIFPSDVEHHKDGDDIEARAPARSSVKTPKAKPNPKLKPIPKPKPKPTPKPISTRASSAVQPLKTKTCKQVYALALSESKKASLTDERIGARAVARDAGFVGSRMHVEARDTSKDAKGCGMKIDALNYPNDEDMASMPHHVKYYGYVKPSVCEVFGFDEFNRPAENEKKAYQVEHVLEWQLVTGFFDWIDQKKIRKNNRKFDNPDRQATTKKLDFCGYFKNTWDGSYFTKFSIDGPNGEKRSALQHLAQAYPGNGADHFQDEFVYLHTTINAPSKSEMWRPKDKENAGIFDQLKIEDKILGNRKGRKPKQTRTAPDVDKAREALMSLKYLMGARKYMRNPKIAIIFKKQKNRIGEMLDRLDKELAKHPRHDVSKPQRFTAWKPQKLKAFWDEYMNEKFMTAHLRTHNEMDTYLAMFHREWVSWGASMQPEVEKLQKDIKVIQNAWESEKRNKWTVPW